jgi:hypothetical protein
MTRKAESGGGGEYAIGYRKPPEHTRFQEGKSGNPAGRPRGSRNFNTLLTTELAKTVAVRNGSTVRRVPKREALVAMMVNKALQGDPRMVNLLIGLLQRVAAEGVQEGGGEPTLGRADKEIIDAFLARGLTDDKPE